MDNFSVLERQKVCQNGKVFVSNPCLVLSIVVYLHRFSLEKNGQA